MKMQDIFKTYRDKFPAKIFFFIFAVVFALRLPFTGAGAGTDPDAWRLINAAKQISLTGEYHASRLPGYPVVEAIMAVLFCLSGSEKILFFLVPLCSAVAAVLFALTAQRLGISSPAGLAFAFSFTPVIAINGTGTMDYIPALMFVLAGIYFVITGKAAAAGTAIGLAAGCRITSVIFIVPLFFLLYRKNKTLKMNAFFLVPAAVSGLLCYLPAVNRYGLNFFSFTEMSGISVLLTIVQSVTGVWGSAGALAVALLCCEIARRIAEKKTTMSFAGYEKDVLLIAVIGIGLQMLLYLRLPNDPAYLIPAVPLFWLLAGTFSPQKYHLWMAGAMAASSLFIGIESADRDWSVKPSSISFPFEFKERKLAVDILHGPLLADFYKRKRMMEYAESLTGDSIRDGKKRLIATGIWFPMVVVTRGGVFPPDEKDDFVFEDKGVLFTGLLSSDAAKKFQQEGINIFFIPEQDKYNERVRGIDLKTVGRRVVQ